MQKLVIVCAHPDKRGKTMASKIQYATETKGIRMSPSKWVRIFSAPLGLDLLVGKRLNLEFGLNFIEFRVQSFSIKLKPPLFFTVVGPT